MKTDLNSEGPSQYEVTFTKVAGATPNSIDRILAIGCQSVLTGNLNAWQKGEALPTYLGISNDHTNISEPMPGKLLLTRGSHWAILDKADFLVLVKAAYAPPPPPPTPTYSMSSTYDSGPGGHYSAHYGGVIVRPKNGWTDCPIKFSIGWGDPNVIFLDENMIPIQQAGSAKLKSATLTARN